MAVGRSEVGAWYQFNENMALGATASVDLDVRDGKQSIAGASGGLQVVGTFGHRTHASAPTTATSIEDGASEE